MPHGYLLRHLCCWVAREYCALAFVQTESIVFIGCIVENDRSAVFDTGDTYLGRLRKALHQVWRMHKPYSSIYDD